MFNAVPDVKEIMKVIHKDLTSRNNGQSKPMPNYHRAGAILDIVLDMTQKR